MFLPPPSTLSLPPHHRQQQAYYLGCPIWANKDWVGSFFTKRAKSPDYLRQYAKVFNSVEGSATFYSLPSSETVLRWKQETPERFRFTFKFPRVITHDYKLRDVRQETLQFFRTIEPLAARIGILFLQLPPTFGLRHLPDLDAYLSLLPTESGYNYAVEVRNRDFFDRPENAQHLDNLLAARNINRAVFDTSVLHSQHSQDALTLEAQRKKPKMPSYFTATAQYPFVRYVGHITPSDNIERLNTIARYVVEWVEEGRKPYIFMHTPGDLYAPQLCRLFHNILSEIWPKAAVPLWSLPPFPSELETEQAEQMSLF